MKEMKGREVLITGGAGFIGSNLAHTLFQAGAQVTVVDNLFPELGSNPFNLASIFPGISFIEADIADYSKIYQYVKRAEFIFNLAGNVSHIDSIISPIFDLRTNVESQLYFLDYCRKDNPGATIVFAGTRQVYGVPVYLPVDEAISLKSKLIGATK